jgi:hypothetical protein
MNRDLALYVIRYYYSFMHTHEKLAYTRLTATMKATHGRSDSDVKARQKINGLSCVIYSRTIRSFSG